MADMNPEGNLENNQSQWEVISDSEKDKRDFSKLEVKLGWGDSPMPPGEGMLLRKNNEPIGYIRFTIDKWGSGPKSLRIFELEVLKEERRADYMAQLVYRLKEYAKQHGAERVAWIGALDTTHKLTRNLDPEKYGEYFKVVPIDEFDIKLFLGRL